MTALIMAYQPVKSIASLNATLQTAMASAQRIFSVIDMCPEITDEKIRPAVAQDGGDIKFVKFSEGIVFLQLRGACAGCPSSTITLKHGVERMIKHYVPEVTSVEAININE